MFILKIMRACGVRSKYLKTQSKGGFLRRPFEPAAVCGQINRLAVVLGDSPRYSRRSGVPLPRKVGS